MNRREFIAACAALPIAGKVKTEPVVDYCGAFTIGNRASMSTVHPSWYTESAHHGIGLRMLESLELAGLTATGKQS